mmetsp:Transcript_83462/g.131471  ORF Transcript_83462/g.131471 Transcript_83462/m.131471 type:complete len:496 (+) Transcript_83462:116-1603(+)
MMIGSQNRYMGTGRRMSQHGGAAKPKLARSTSSLAASSISSETSGSPHTNPTSMRDKYKRKSVYSSSFTDSIPDEPKLPPAGTNFTFTDLFLQDHSKDIVASISTIGGGTRPFIPLPPGVSPGLMQLQREEMKHEEIKSIELRRKAIQERQLEEYFKPHASWTHFPKLEDRRKRMSDFSAQFHAGELDETILRHCGENLKLLAYVVVSVDKVGVRSSPSLSEEAQTGEVLCPGQMVMVQSILNFDKTKFLKLSTGGWVFNRKGNTKVMAYVSNIEIGLWWYRVVSQEFAEVREAPSESERVRSGFVMVPGEVCVVNIRCLVENKSWMHLADGRGWMFEMRPESAPTLTGKTDDGVREIVMAECKEEISAELEEEQSHGKAMNAAEVGMWEYEILQSVLAIGASISGWLLRRGDKVFVDMRVPANGRKEVKNSADDPLTRIWLRLNDGRGWLPKTDVSGTPIVRFRKMAGVEPRLTISKKESNLDENIEDWKTGVA